MDAGLLTLLLQTVVVLAVAGLILWLYVQRNVIARLEALALVMRKLAQGDLDVEVRTSGSDELSEMAETVKVVPGAGGSSSASSSRSASERKRSSGGTRASSRCW